ncbi:DNA-directed RNA polymerase sigma-70 factor [Reticulibacter mediterranei]|uniref:DNA-directed RNA polymerase sigma-70 factor n=1 Tax=Reticulibacter mediterranei TaxID=2778369 RepID=A0A8J3IVP6_9CHLR|nr:sigma-70 family RNA polymerase sigma factor [Reticulibacter mediterranei]GHO99418.1 DNA-directed RNA polymerase sigma-70 factor [Reticulibacter mediterranei]
MEKHEWLTEAFEAERPHLQTVAYRLLGSTSEADDAVQEAWLRLSFADSSSVENLGGWLTTVVARISLNMLRSRNVRREEPLEASALETSREEIIDPEQEALLADSVGIALLVILDTLAPAERLAFVLHDIFAVPFDEIAPIVERSEAATRQLASRARRRIQEGAKTQDTNLTYQREVVEAFLAASRAGNFEALVALLDPDVVFRTDWPMPAEGFSREIRGAAAVAKQLLRRAHEVQPILINGAVGIVVAPPGQRLLVAQLTITNGRIARINAISDPTHLSRLHLAVLSD